MSIGTVKWFNDDKGFGFISPDGGGADLFAHFSEIIRDSFSPEAMRDGFATLREGQKVRFEIVHGPKMPRASNIQAV